MKPEVSTKTLMSSLAAKEGGLVLQSEYVQHGDMCNLWAYPGSFLVLVILLVKLTWSRLAVVSRRDVRREVCLFEAHL